MIYILTNNQPTLFISDMSFSSSAILLSLSSISFCNLLFSSLSRSSSYRDTQATIIQTIAVEYLQFLLSLNIQCHLLYLYSKMSRRMGKPIICIGENKGTDQLRSNCEADQGLFAKGTVQFFYFLNPKFPGSNHLL